jgi:hypothetical protein
MRGRLLDSASNFLASSEYPVTAATTKWGCRDNKMGIIPDATMNEQC